MEVKPVQNDDFLQLADLCIAMYKSIDAHINEYQSINTLVHFINNNKNFKAIGLYNKDKLIGFSMGYELNPAQFLFTGIYVSVKNTTNTRKLIDFSFQFIRDLGYTGWQVDATNPNISKIMEKYGAKVAFTRYMKEFE